MSISSVLLACLLAVPSGGQRAQQERARDTGAQIDAVLSGVTRLAESARAANQLARLGGEVVEPLFERLCADQDVPRRAAILGAFALLPHEPVLSFLAQLARRPPDDLHKSAGLDLLARLGETSELGLALELGSSSDPEAPPSAELGAALEAALFGIASRERSAGRNLAELFPRATPAAQASIASVLARIGGHEGVSLLAGLLGRAAADADALLLLELGEAAESSALVEDLLVLERVRGHLGHPDPRLVVLAAAATGALADDAAVPDLVVLLEDSRPNVRRAAHAALVRLTGSNLAADPKGWLAWLDQGLVWWDERADACRIALGSGDAAEAAAALQEVARQRLFVREVVPLLALAARRSEPDLVRGACRALAALPVRPARAALLALCALPDESLAEEARLALNKCVHPRSSALRTHAPLPSLSQIP